MGFTIKDSGQRQQFNTGAVRDTSEGKGRYDLLPAYALQRLAVHFENGAKKYDAENWRKGIPLRRFMDSGLRHALKYLEGQRDEDHMAAAAWNFLCLIETEEMIRRGILPKELNNLPDWFNDGWTHEAIDAAASKLPESGTVVYLDPPDKADRIDSPLPSDLDGDWDFDNQEIRGQGGHYRISGGTVTFINPQGVEEEMDDGSQDAIHRFIKEGKVTRFNPTPAPPVPVEGVVYRITEEHGPKLYRLRTTTGRVVEFKSTITGNWVSSRESFETLQAGLQSGRFIVEGANGK